MAARSTKGSTPKVESDTIINVSAMAKVLGIPVTKVLSAMCVEKGGTKLADAITGWVRDAAPGDTPLTFVVNRGHLAAHFVQKVPKAA